MDFSKHSRLYGQWPRQILANRALGHSRQAGAQFLNTGSTPAGIAKTPAILILAFSKIIRMFGPVMSFGRKACADAKADVAGGCEGHGLKQVVP
jgi:hypothetical protein